MGKKRRARRSPDAGGSDPLREWKDWQDHQYLPGYWVGGKIPPFLLGKRPNRFGYLLVAGGIGACLFVALRLVLMGPRLDWGETVFALLFALLQLGAGISLLRRS